MKFSKLITDYSQTYGITPKDVAFCILVSSGVTRADSYGLLFNASLSSPAQWANAATRLAASKPNINRLIDLLTQQRNNTQPTTTTTRRTKHPDILPDDNESNLRSNINLVGGKSFRDKSEIIDELVSCLSSVRGVDKVNVLMKIADLQQMKKEATQEEQRVLFYLPIKCESCPLRSNL